LSFSLDPKKRQYLNFLMNLVTTDPEPGCPENASEVYGSIKHRHSELHWAQPRTVLLNSMCWKGRETWYSFVSNGNSRIYPGLWNAKICMGLDSWQGSSAKCMILYKSTLRRH